MTISIETTTDGLHEVVRHEPVVLGSFVQREHAEMFAMALNAAPAAPVQAPVAPPAEPDPVGMTNVIGDPVTCRADSNATPAVADEPPPAEPAPAPAAREPGLAPVPLGAPPEVDAEPEDSHWEAALDRLEAGEGCKAVAEDMGLPFGRLRAKWAGCIRNGSRRAPEVRITAPAPARTPVPRETADSPVSGGVGAVLARGGSGVTFTSEEEAELIELAPDGMIAFSARTGHSVSACSRRQAQLRAGIQRLMNDGGGA